MRTVALILAVVVTVSCGGDSPSPSPSPTPGPDTTARGGLYLGYYAEDRNANPEDPTAGALYLNLPETDSPFSGSMFFTYVGCQSSNIGTVSGTKRGPSLSGSWSGPIDGTVRSGSFTGTYDGVQRFYAGVYTVAGGKQFVRVPGCIDYYIAPNGTWELFLAEENVPRSFAPDISGSTATWACPAGAVSSLVVVFNGVAVQIGAEGVHFQTVVSGGSGSQSVPGLQRGSTYIATVVCLDASLRRVAVGSRRFVA